MFTDESCRLPQLALREPRFHAAQVQLTCQPVRYGVSVQYRAAGCQRVRLERVAYCMSQVERLAQASLVRVKAYYALFYGYAVGHERAQADEVGLFDVVA